jgi:hypothetical protein
LILSNNGRRFPSFFSRRFFFRYSLLFFPESSHFLQPGLFIQGFDPWTVSAALRIIIPAVGVFILCPDLHAGFHPCSGPRRSRYRRAVEFRFRHIGVIEDGSGEIRVPEVRASGTDSGHFRILEVRLGEIRSVHSRAVENGPGQDCAA